MASTIKVDNVQNQPGTNIVSKCGTDVTIGASGDTVALAAGASQTGFGRTGTVDWITTPKVTGDSPVTGVTGKGYFLNTTAGTITLNLPAGAAGSIVSVADYTRTWQTNNVTVSPNGAEKIGGTAADITLNTEGQSVTLVYVDGTEGWINVQDSTSAVGGSEFIVATGGTPCSGAIVCTNYKTHTFTGPGTFCVSAGIGPLAVADYIIVAGGGGGAGGNDRGAAGGAGGFRGSSGTAAGCYAAGCAPLVGPVGAHPVSASPGAYAIVVGGGGAGATSAPGIRSGTVGVGSSALGTTVAGGGYGGGRATGGTGGSGGGGGEACFAGGAGNTPTLSPPQGRNGGIGGGPVSNGGGGGVSGLGGAATGPQAGPGGQDINNSITGSPVYYAGGGGGGGQKCTSIQGAASPGGSGGAGGAIAGSPPHDGLNGAANRGGGGGGASNRSGGYAAGGGNGGGGVVVIRYKFQ